MRMVIIKVRKTWVAENSSFKKQTYSPKEEKWIDNGFGGFDSLFTKAAPIPIAINAMESEDSLNEKVNMKITNNPCIWYYCYWN